jgi:dethiobiotin synthetase
MSTALFVTGTDTSIGKTMVTAAIARALCDRGLDVGVYKPAETGVPLVDGHPVGEDCARLAAAAGGWQEPDEVASVLLDLPAAPLVAAEAQGTSIDPAMLVAEIDKRRTGQDVLLVEGAGGLLVPIAPGFTYRELAVGADLETILVVGSRLGCINHALLSLQALEIAGITVRGWILNTLVADAADADASNRDIIGRFTDTPCLGTFPFVPEAARSDYEHLAGLAESSLALDALVPKEA